MIRYEDECVDCAMYCLGSSCPKRHVKHLYCDKCGADVEKLFVLDGVQLCEECLHEELEEVTLDE